MQLPKVLFTICLLLMTVSAGAQVLYSNGPTNGNTDAWAINYSGMVTDSAFEPNGGITGAEFAMWLFPGDILISAQITITSQPFGGITYFNSIVNFTQSGCEGNYYGYDVCTERTNFNGPSPSGTYWLTLKNASDDFGEPVYWDENSGPSQAMQSPGKPEWWIPNALGTIPSESFTVLGEMTCNSGNCAADTPTVPEPGSITLLTSGCITLLGLLGGLRRKLF